MKDFRNPEYVERYEDVVFDLEIPLITNVANAVSQKKDGYKFVADNTGEVAPFDWYNARINIDFKVELLADGEKIKANDHIGIVNGSHSLIRGLKVEANGISVYDCDPSNQAVNIKNLLDYLSQYAKDMGTNQFYFLDVNDHAEERKMTAANPPVIVANYNKGFATRKALLGLSAEVNTEIPLNRYSFFERLNDELLPNMKVGIRIELESDANLIWRGTGDGAADCRVIITRMQLFVPRITFTPRGVEEYTKAFTKPRVWTYLREEIYSSNPSRQQTGTFKITSAIDRPRDVFVWIMNNARKDNQEQNPFLFDTFSVANNRALSSCRLEVGNGNHYPENEYQPSTQMARVFRDIHKYSYTENEYQGGSTLLNRGNFSTIFPFIYFDLRNPKGDIKDGATKLTFEYKLSGGTNADYTVYALVLYEKDVKIDSISGKLMVRT